MKIKALIIEDEPLARNVIVEYSKKIEFLDIVCSCEDALQGLEKLNDTIVDLLFLDINMPHLSGIAFLKSLKNPPLVIITSAYSDYALEGYELNVVDYLKKPFSFGCYQLSIQSNGDVTSCCESLTPIAKMTDDIENIIHNFKETLTPCLKCRKCLGCPSQKFLCGYIKELNAKNCQDVVKLLS